MPCELGEVLDVAAPDGGFESSVVGAERVEVAICQSNSSQRVAVLYELDCRDVVFVRDAEMETISAGFERSAMMGG